MVRALHTILINTSYAVECEKPANTSSKWKILGVVRSAIRRMQEIFREKNRNIEAEKRKRERERELFEKQEQLLEEPKLLCSLFPGEYEIERDTLVQLWMAGGLLKNVHIDDEEGYLVKSNEDGGILEDYGSLYLQTLEKQDFILPSTLDKRKYKVNTESFFIGKTQIADGYCQLKEENGGVCAPSSSSVKPRHVSLTLAADHVDEVALFKTLKEFDGLRTLLFMGSSSLKQVPSDVFSTLTVLQTLDFSGSQISELPASIGNLTQLHYLDLSYTPIVRLPESIECLQELQTLKIKGCKHFVELPPGLNKLIRLRHLHFDDNLSKVARMPRGLGALTELHTLSAFMVDNSDGCNIDELKSLKNLSGSLCASGLENISLDDDEKKLDDSIIEKLEPPDSLKELQISGYLGTDFPPWMGIITALTRVHLFNCKNTTLDIPLGDLPALEYLEIVQMNTVTTLGIKLRGDGSIAFSKLETLVVDGMCTLKSWHENDEITEKDFPKLSKLVIKQCPELTRLRFLLHISSLTYLEISSSGIVELLLPKISSLKTFKINYCPSLTKKYSRGGDNWHKIEEVPEIWFDSEELLPISPGKQDMMLYRLLFPNDYEFEKEKLIHLWIAAGFLKDEPMEDHGHRFFDFLLAQRFIEKKGTTDSSDGEMYEINSKCFSSFENQMVESRHFTEKIEKKLRVAANRSDEDRDISIMCREVEQENENFELLEGFFKLRSILFLKGSALTTVPSHIFSALEFLKILDLSDCKGIKELPSSVRHATNLRYLGLSRTRIERLPDSITDLSELQTLELKGCLRLFHLPKRMNRLTNLRHLDFDILGQLTSMPKGIGALAELRTLWAFIVGREEGWNIKELQTMNHLSGKLCISGLENVMKLEESQEAALIQKDRLSQLELRWRNAYEKKNGCDYDGVLEGLQPNTNLKELQIICFPGSAFPKWLGDDSYANLDSIMLYKCEDCKRLPALGGLPKLQRLEIFEMHGVEEMDDRMQYPALKKLTIDGMRSLKKWRLLNGGDIFPSLTELFIKHCPKLETVSTRNNGILSSILNLIPNYHTELDGIACKSVEIVECPKLKDLPDVLRLDLLEKLIIMDCPFGEKYRAGRDGRKKITKEKAEVFVLP